MKIQSVTIVLQNSRGEILICKRSPNVSYFPNAWVFPGGKMENPIEGWSGMEEEALNTGLQELYEETGIIIGEKTIFTDRSGSWKDKVSNKNVMQRIRSEFRFAGRRQTPPFDKGIFDTGYYYHKSSAYDGIEARGDGSEIVEIEWIHPQKAIEQFEEGVRHYFPPVLYTFRLLDKFGENFPSEGVKQTSLPPGLQTPVEFAPEYFIIPLPANTAHPFTTTNLGIIRGNQATLVIDPGWNEECTWGEDLLHHYVEGKVHVFITHHHSDHWHALPIIEKLYPNAILHSHPETIKELQTSLNVNSMSHMELDLGERIIEFIEAPGHTSGHMIALDRKTRLIYGGDHIVGRGTALLDPRTGSMAQYLKTLQIIADLKPKILVPSHGRPNFRPLKMIERYRKHRLEREDQILSVLGDEKSVDEILEIVYAEVPKKVWKYARYNILKHLEKLLDENRISDEGGKYLLVS